MSVFLSLVFLTLPFKMLASKFFHFFFIAFIKQGIIKLIKAIKTFRLLQKQSNKRFWTFYSQRIWKKYITVSTKILILKALAAHRFSALIITQYYHFYCHFLMHKACFIRLCWFLTLRDYFFIPLTILKRFLTVKPNTLYSKYTGI